MAKQRPTRSALALAPLSEWSIAHIKSIFQAASHDDALQAIDETFSKDVEAHMNGLRIDLEDIKTQVLGLRRSSKTGLVVRWEHIVEAPNRAEPTTEGWVGGVYVIQGISRVTADQPSGTDYERHKAITVKIASPEGIKSNQDNRRIVTISFIAEDVKLDRVVRAAL